MLKAAGADPFPTSNLFCNISSASELKSLVENVIFGSSDCDRGILRAVATQYSMMGQMDSSEEMGLLALKKTEIVLGDDHLETLHCCIFVAQQFVLHSKNEEAEPMLRKLLDGLRLGIGLKHPDSLQVSFTLAEILENQGKLEEAEGFALLAKIGMFEALGPEHPQTLQTSITLANILEKQGKFGEAKEIASLALDVERLESVHPETLRAFQILFWVLEI